MEEFKEAMHIHEEELIEIKNFASEQLKEVKEEVKLIIFLDKPSKCHYCADVKAIMDIISKACNKLKLKYYLLEKDKEKAEEFKVNEAPVIIFEKKGKRNIKYYGIPGGYEFPVFLETIKAFANNETKLSSFTKEKLKEIKKDINIKILVTLSCPYCPLAARISNYFAIENERIVSEIIDADEFKEIAEKYAVMAVPKIVINDKIELVGAQPESKFLQEIVKL